MKEYIKNISKTNELVLNGILMKDELDRFSKADSRWADNKQKGLQTRKIKKGEVYQFEFGKNFMPEMSYEHRGLVIGVNKKLLYVLPIYSYDTRKHTDVYHPVDNNESKSDLYLLKQEEYSFIQRDSVLKLNDIRTVSVNRILYHQKDGRMDIDSPEYKKIEELVLNKYFPSFLYDLKASILNEKQLEAKNCKQERKISDLENEIKALKDKIVELEFIKDKN